MNSQTDQEIVDLLIRALQSETIRSPEEATITAHGPAAAPTLIAVMRGELDELLTERGLLPSEARGEAAWMLAKIADPASIEPILDFVTRFDPTANQHFPVEALWDALAATGSTALEPTLRAYARAEEPKSRPGLGLVLSQLGVRDERIFPILVETFYESLHWGACAMGEYGDQRAVPHLKHALDKFLPSIRGTHPGDIDADYEAILEALDKLAPLSDEEFYAFERRRAEYERRQWEAAQAGKTA